MKALGSAAIRMIAALRVKTAQCEARDAANASALATLATTQCAILAATLRGRTVLGHCSVTRLAKAAGIRCASFLALPQNSLRPLRPFVWQQTLSAIALLCIALPAVASYRDDPKTALLHQKLIADYAFTDRDLLAVDEALDEAVRQPQLVQAERQNKEITTPLWDNYRALHVFPKQIENGLRVLQENQQWFARAESEYGVPPVVIAAILGVETKYGTYTGRNRVLDALVTQGYEHPTRSAFFFNELAAYFALCRDTGRVPDSVKGSYAGAVGFAQFMPSNYLSLAVDYDGNGVIDLWSMPDAIGSIARYFTRYEPVDRPPVHWRRGEPLVIPATVTALSANAPARNTKAANATLGAWVKAGVTPAVTMPADLSAGLLELRRPDGLEYWLALPNFYAVMTYNPRVFYAMAVTQLAAELQAAQGAQVSSR